MPRPNPAGLPVIPIAVQIVYGAGLAGRLVTFGNGELRDLPPSVQLRHAAM